MPRTRRAVRHPLKDGRRSSAIVRAHSRAVECVAHINFNNGFENVSHIRNANHERTHVRNARQIHLVSAHELDTLLDGRLQLGNQLLQTLLLSSGQLADLLDVLHALSLRM